MKRKGKYEEWRRRYEEAKKDVAPEDWKIASDKVMEEMGFLGKEKSTQLGCIILILAFLGIQFVLYLFE